MNLFIPVSFILLAWDANPEPNITGYRVTASNGFETTVTETKCAIPVVSGSISFSVAAVDSLALESVPASLAGTVVILVIEKSSDLRNWSEFKRMVAFEPESEPKKFYRSNILK